MPVVPSGLIDGLFLHRVASVGLAVAPCLPMKGGRVLLAGSSLPRNVYRIVSELHPPRLPREGQD